jgi:hypothetical protein
MSSSNFLVLYQCAVYISMYGQIKLYEPDQEFQELCMISFYDQLLCMSENFDIQNWTVSV